MSAKVVIFAIACLYIFQSQGFAELHRDVNNEFLPTDLTFSIRITNYRDYENDECGATTGRSRFTSAVMQQLDERERDV